MPEARIALKDTCRFARFAVLEGRKRDIGNLEVIWRGDCFPEHHQEQLDGIKKIKRRFIELLDNLVWVRIRSRLKAIRILTEV